MAERMRESIAKIDEQRAKKMLGFFEWTTEREMHLDCIRLLVGSVKGPNASNSDRQALALLLVVAVEDGDSETLELAAKLATVPSDQTNRTHAALVASRKFQEIHKRLPTMKEHQDFMISNSMSCPEPDDKKGWSTLRAYARLEFPKAKPKRGRSRQGGK